MLKAILADDEEVILNGIEKMIDWDEYGIEIAAKVTDGKSALRAIEEKEPDIVITDVKMPHISGIELIDAIGEEKRQKIKFIFISAYQEFDYVKAALSKGAVDYLLKPVRKKDLEAVLAKTTEQIDDRRTVEIFKDRKANLALRDIFSNMDEGYDYTSDFIYDAFIKKNVKADNRFFVAMCVGILKYNFAQERAEYEKRKLLQFVIYNKIVDMIVGGESGFVVKKDDSSCNIVAVVKDEKKDDFIREVILPMKKAIEDRKSTRLNSSH